MRLKIRKYDPFGKHTDKVCITALFMITLIVHLTVSLRMKMLHMSQDEMGVLATAAYAVGEDWSAVVSKFGYYGYGSSLLYIPIFALTKGPVLRYRLITTLNSVLMSLIPVIAYRIASKYCKASKKTSFIAALVTGLYPGYLLFSKWVWNETMMCLLPWVAALLVFRLYSEQDKPKRIIFSVLLSLTLVYSYAVHGRALGLIAAVILIIVLIAVFQKRLIVEPVSFCSSFTVFYICDHFAKKFVQSRVWLVGSDGELNNTLGGNTGKLHDYTSFDGFRGLLRIASGQLSAASASTYGILVIALVPAVPVIIGGFNRKMRLRKDRLPDDKHNLWLLMTVALTFFAAAFAISVLFLGNEGSNPEPRGDYYIYTRYFSNMLGFSVFAAFIYFSRSEMSNVMTAVTLGVYALCTVPILHYADFLNGCKNSANTTILNLLAYLGDNPRDYIAHFDFENLILVTSIVFGAALIGLAAKKQGMLAVLLCWVFLGSYYDTADDVILVNSRKEINFVQPTMNALYNVDGLDDEYDDIYYYNVHQTKPWSGSAMQYSLPEYELTEFDFEVNETTDPERLLSFITENSIIVSSEDIFLEQFSPDIYRIEYESIGSGTEYMWVYGEDIRDYILANSDLRIVSDKEQE
ncbi:MAG: hypothetical protein IKO47_12295 [Ruminococcus sp.]|nr:hypothetical protein [Ruminococcus sp.]